MCRIAHIAAASPALPVHPRPGQAELDAPSRPKREAYRDEKPVKFVCNRPEP